MTTKEKIKCPSCEVVQLATVDLTWPWFSYVHECTNCQYIIMESEWDRVDSPEPTSIEQKHA